jgi:hypothetical protein
VALLLNFVFLFLFQFKLFCTIQVKVPEWLDPPFTEAEIQTITHVVPIKDVR